jgi:Bor protein
MAERNQRLVARNLSRAWLAVGSFALLGCTATPRAVEPVREHWVPGYVFGIWGKSELDMRDDCPTTGAARVRIGATWSTFLVSIVTLGAYTPSNVTVHCRAQP